MDLLKMGQELLGDKLGDNAGGLMEAISGLTGGSGGLDLGSLAAKFQENGLGEQLQSWLGDGDNAPISADQVKQVFGEDQLGALASKLGGDASSAAEQLKDLIPGLLDKASSGGSLLEQFTGGDAGGMLDMAKNLFNK